MVVMAIEGWFNCGMQNGINFHSTFSQIVD